MVGNTKCLTLLLLSLVLMAGNWRQDGKSVPDTAWAKSSGDFGAQLVFTDKPDELFAAWEKPGPVVLISESKNAIRGGSPIVGVVFFVGCARNEQGNCNSVVTFKMLGPDGKPWGTDILEGELWVDKPPPSDSEMQLSLGNIGIVIEPKDQLGIYTVIAEVRDKISGKRLVLERKFEALEGK